MKDKVYLTFDIDWASDEVITYTLNLLENLRLSATFFITHDTPLLERIRDVSYWEIGAHPNFIPMNLSDFNTDNFNDHCDEILSFFRNLIPEATSIRTHGLLQSSRISIKVKEYGFERESNLLIVKSSNVKVKPFYHWTGLLCIPYFWEDYIHCVEINKGLYSWRGGGASWSITV